MNARLLATLALVLAAGCAPRYQSIRMDVPVGATVRIAKGVYTPEVVFRTPFVGRFEIGGLHPLGGFPLVFDLDQASARAYGADRPLRIYARMSVGSPTEFSRTQTLRLTMSNEKLTALVRGEVSEISSFVADPSSNYKQLATLTMRLAPF